LGGKFFVCFLFDGRCLKKIFLLFFPIDFFHLFLFLFFFCVITTLVSTAQHPFHYYANSRNDVWQSSIYFSTTQPKLWNLCPSAGRRVSWCLFFFCLIKKKKKETAENRNGLHLFLDTHQTLRKAHVWSKDGVAVSLQDRMFISQKKEQN